MAVTPTPRTRRVTVGGVPGAALAATLAGVHLDLVRAAADEAPYLGVLFVAAAVAFTGGAALVLTGRSGRAPWWALAALGVGAAGGYLLSRTVGLPGVPTQPWTALGDVSLGLDGALTAVAAVTLAIG